MLYCNRRVSYLWKAWFTEAKRTLTSGSSFVLQWTTAVLKERSFFLFFIAIYPCMTLGEDNPFTALIWANNFWAPLQTNLLKKATHTIKANVVQCSDRVPKLKLLWFRRRFGLSTLKLNHFLSDTHILCCLQSSMMRYVKGFTNIWGPLTIEKISDYIMHSAKKDVLNVWLIS